MRKVAAISIILFIHLLVLMEQRDFHWADFLEIFYSRILQNILNTVYFYC